jgi:Septum formation
MSSKVTGDAQPDAGTGVESNQTLPTGIVGNLAAGPVPVPVPGNTEPTAESGPAPEPAAAPGPDEPTEVTDAAGPADEAGWAELPAGEDGAEDETVAEDREYLAELSDPAEPTELFAMTEPVDMAEPVERRRPRRRWQGVLIALGFVVAAAAIVGGAIAIVGSLTHGFKKPVVIHYTKSAVFSLKTGQCIDPNGQTATIVSCTSPHDAEVFATFALRGSKWPGTAAVSVAASSGCSTRLEGYLNPQLAISLASTYIYPDSVAWQAGTRTVICEVRATSGQLTGSVQGASATAG